mgnify:FL=1
MRIDLSRHVPPGFDLGYELRFFAAGMTLAASWSLSFLYRFVSALWALYGYRGTERYLLPGAVMPDFHTLLGNALTGFLILAIWWIAAFVPAHYAHHVVGSKSIYLMRRLPNRWELHRRCWTLPLSVVLLCLIVAAILLLTYYGIYMAATPEECLTPHQWQKIWSVLP